MVTFDWSNVVVATIGAAPAVVAVWWKSGHEGKKQGKKVDAVHAEVRTNNGKSAGEYIEQAAENTKILTSLLATHTVQDEVRFNQAEDAKKRSDEMWDSRIGQLHEQLKTVSDEQQHARTALAALHPPQVVVQTSGTPSVHVDGTPAPS